MKCDYYAITFLTYKICAFAKNAEVAANYAFHPIKRTMFCFYDPIGKDVEVIFYGKATENRAGIQKL